jgi:hypothetical protein
MSSGELVTVKVKTTIITEKSLPGPDSQESFTIYPFITLF